MAEVGIKADTEEQARVKLIAILKKNDVDGIEKESLQSLFDMAVVFTGPDAASSNSADDADEQEAEDVIDEDEEMPAAKGTKAAPAKPGKKGNPDKEMDALSDEVTKTGKTIPKKNSATAKAPKVKKAGAASARTKLLGKHWDTLTAEQKATALKPFKKLLPDAKFVFDLLQKSFTVKFLGKSSQQNIFKYHLLRLLDNGKLEGVFVAHRMKEIEELEGYLPDSVDVSQRTIKKGDSCSYIHPFSQDEVLEMLTDTKFLEVSIAAAEKQDVKMKTNRDKLDASLNAGNEDAEDEAPASKVKGKATPAPAPAAAGKKKTPAKPVAAVIPEEEEEEMPAAKVTPKKAAAPAKGKKK